MNRLLFTIKNNCLEPVLLRFYKKYLCLILLFLVTSITQHLHAKEISKSQGDPQQISVLLFRLNLDAPELEKVKAAVDEPILAVHELLAYYRGRTFVNILLTEVQKTM